MTAPQQLPAEKPRILVVEDELNVAEVLKARLESYGYEVCRIVSSGTDALTAAAELAPDVIMMDIKIQGPWTASKPPESYADAMTFPSSI